LRFMAILLVSKTYRRVFIMAKEQVNMSRKEASDLHKKIVEHAVKKGHPVWEKKKRA
jgi:hypothetical protein